MNDTQKILQGLADLKSEIAELGKQLNGRMDTIERKTDTLEFKVEAFHSEQAKANQEIINLIVDTSKANGEAHKELEKRVDRIEKHPNLLPVK